MTGHDMGDGTIQDVVTLIPPAPPEIRPSREEIAALAARIGRVFHPERVILFGSRAYGTPTPESDVDLMVVMNSALPPDEQAQQIKETVVPHAPSLLFQIQVRTPAEIRLGVKEHDFFIRNVMRGITLYEGEGMGTFDEEQAEAQEQAGAEPRLKHATQEWLELAEEDARVAHQLWDTPDPPPRHVCFFAQQAIEKLLKGLLQEREIEFPRTHNLVELTELAVPAVPDLAAHEAALKPLNECAVAARYTPRKISREQAAAAVETMDAV